MNRSGSSFSNSASWATAARGRPSTDRGNSASCPKKLQQHPRCTRQMNAPALRRHAGQNWSTPIHAWSHPGLCENGGAVPSVSVPARGINRSSVDNPGQDLTPEMCADDLSWLIHRLDAGPAAVMRFRGGAVSAPALLRAHPSRFTQSSPKSRLVGAARRREQIRAQIADYFATHLAGDVVGACSRSCSNPTK